MTSIGVVSVERRSAVAPETGVGRRERKARTRERLLDVGYRALAESAGATVTEHLKVSDVTAAAGLAAGSFYVHWDSIDDFHTELLHHALHHDRFVVSREATVALMRAAVDAELAFGELARAAAAANVRMVLESTAFQIFIAAWNRGRVDEAIAERLTASYAELNAMYIDVYNEIFDRYGFAFRDDDMDMPRLARMLNAVIDGVVLRAGIDRSLPPSEVERLAGDAVVYLLDGVADGGIDESRRPRTAG